MTDSTSDDPTVAALAGVQEELLLLRGDVRSTRQGVDERIKTWRRLFFAFCALTLVTGYSSLQSRQAVDDIVATRTEARGATCRSDNRFIENHNRLVDSVEAGVQLVNQPNPNRTPEQQAAVDKFVADYIATVEQSRVALRDCSPEAIDAFYKEK